MRPTLSLDYEFDLMVEYQIILESKTVIVENGISVVDRFLLYGIVEPIPTYDEYLNGNEFEEGLLILASNNLNYVKAEQNKRRKTTFISYSEQLV